jgi:hypothetical protein
LSLNTGTGAITGTPTVNGTFTFTVQAHDAVPTTLSRQFQIKVFTLNPVTLPAATVGTFYNTSLTASGGTAPYTWAITSGALPANMTLSTAGLISGTPTSPAAATFTVQVTDSTGSAATRTYTLTPGVAALTITQTTLPTFTVGTFLSTTLSATGGVKGVPQVGSGYTWSVTGTLPTGLALNATTGVLSGTVTATTSRTFTVNVTDFAATPTTFSRTFTITPAVAALNITNGNVALTFNVFSSTPLAATGGVAPYTWSLGAGSTALPAGMSIVGNALRGTPTVHGTFNNIILQVTDSRPVSFTKTISITIP